LRLLPVQIAVLTNTVLVQKKIQQLALIAQLVETVQEVLQFAVIVLLVKSKTQRRMDVIIVE
jgi:hypothetical protein